MQIDKPIDPRKKYLAIGGTVIALVVLAGGVTYTYRHTPLPQPATAEEGLASIQSARYDHMPADRQREYREQTFALLRELPRDERRKLMEDRPDLQPGMEEMRESGMQEMGRRWALATPEERQAMLEGGPGGFFGGRPRGDRPRGDRPESDRPEGERPRRGEDSNRTPEEQAQRQADRQGHMKDRMQDHFTNGNPQAGAFIGEFFKARREGRED